MPRCLSTVAKKPKGWHIIMHCAVWTSLIIANIFFFSTCLWRWSQDTIIGCMFCVLWVDGRFPPPRKLFNSIQGWDVVVIFNCCEFGFQMTATHSLSPGNTSISRLLLEHALFATQARVGVQQVAHDAVLLLCKDDVLGNHEDTQVMRLWVHKRYKSNLYDMYAIKLVKCQKCEFDKWWQLWFVPSKLICPKRFRTFDPLVVETVYLERDHRSRKDLSTEAGVWQDRFQNFQQWTEDAFFVVYEEIVQMMAKCQRRLCKAQFSKYPWDPVTLCYRYLSPANWDWNDMNVNVE